MRGRRYRDRIPIPPSLNVTITTRDMHGTWALIRRNPHLIWQGSVDLCVSDVLLAVIIRESVGVCRAQVFYP